MIKDLPGMDEVIFYEPHKINKVRMMSMGKKTGAFLLTGVLYCLLSSALPAVELVRDGKAQSVIVISAEASPAVRSAAMVLQKHLCSLTGLSFPVKDDKQSKSLSGKDLICVGESLFTEKARYKKSSFPEGSSGYEILIRDRMVILNGPVHDGKRRPSKWEKGFHEQRQAQVLSPVSRRSLTADNGVMHAVSAFLEELGVRFYAPGKAGTFYPRKNSVSLPAKEIRKQAAFSVREYLFAPGMQVDEDTLLYLQMLKGGSARTRVGVLPLADVMRRNPHFPRAKNREGKEIVSLDGSGIPLYSHKGFREACAETLRRIFDSDRSLKEVQIIYPASRGNYDHDELEKYTVRITYPGPAASSSLAVDFHRAMVRELAKTHPGRKLLYEAPRYARTAEEYMKDLPKTLQGSPVPVLPHTYAGRRGKNYRKDLPVLTGTFGGGKGYQKEFWNEFSNNDIFRQGFFFMKELQKTRLLQKDHLHGVIMALPYDGSLKEISGKELLLPMLYVNSKLLWDPGLDVDKLLDGYFHFYYGPAASVMRNFYACGEYIYTRGRSRSIAQKNGSLREEDVPGLFELLRQAKSRCPAGSVYHKRIASLEKELLWMKQAFANVEPKGKEITAETFRVGTVCDGDLSKYKKFYPLSHGDLPGMPRTEFAVAARDDRRDCLLAIRCYEPEMERLKRQKKYKEDSLQILSGDHIRILFRNARSGPFEAVISSGGAVLDRVHDPDRFGGDYTSWNSALHRPVIRYYKDRWEMEILFGNIGMIPDFEPAWGFRVERVRTLNGRRQMAANCEGRSFEMGKWSALSFPKTDSFGVEYISSGCVVRPLKGIPNGEVYCIGKARNKVTFSPEAWSDPAAWGKVPESRLGNELFYYWRSNMVGHRPDTAFKMLYDEKNLYIFYKVRDRYVRGNCKKDQGMVCVDSCVELFIMPGGQGKYFNFEMNCVGSLLLYQITPVGRRTLMERVPMEELKKVKRYHSLPRDLKGEITEEVCWYAALEIPLDFFVRFAGVTLPLRGQVWTGNVYKCADWTSHPCWLTWRRTITFHAVDGFGKFIFE